MIVKEFDGRDERFAVTSLCLDTTVLAAVAGQLESNPFSSKWANIVTGWCVSHYQVYGESPGATGIEARFVEWAPSADEALAKIVESWLTGLDPETGLSTDYAIDLVRKTAQKASLKRLHSQLSVALEKNKPEEAADLVSGWSRPKVGESLDGVFPLDDEEAVSQAFDHVQRDSLIQYPGALGEFFGPTLCRDAFVALMGAEKTGKSFWLMDMCALGLSQGRRIAFFSVGDMSQSQVLLRLAPRLCRKPLRKGNFRIPKTLTYKDKTPIVEYDQRRSQSDISKEELLEAFRRLRGKDAKRFRLVTEPAGSMSAFDISKRIKRWAEEGWSPEVLIVDYADILAGPPGFREVRDQINANWQELRALSTRMNCLVLTATQSDAEGYSSWLLGKRNFSDCKKKISHVTNFVGINMTEEERRLGVCRLNAIATRESEFLSDCPGTIVACAGSSHVGRACLISTWI